MTDQDDKKIQQKLAANEQAAYAAYRMMTTRELKGLRNAFLHDRDQKPLRPQYARAFCQGRIDLIDAVLAERTAAQNGQAAN